MAKAIHPATWTMVPTFPGNTMPVTMVRAIANTNATEPRLIRPSGVRN